MSANEDDTDRMDEMIQLIASKNGIAVSKDDPVMILYTMNDRLINDTKLAQSNLLDNFKSEMEVVYQKWSVEAKNNSDRILNASIMASKDEIARMMDEQSGIIIKKWEYELNSAFGKFSDTIHSSRQSAILNIIASCISLFSALIILYIFINL